tara:strand:- start:427 stop:597 length:171 start_codon:yes stop_codon:yes gene_type:complete
MKAKNENSYKRYYSKGKNYNLTNIDPELFAKVKSKLALKGITFKDFIIDRMQRLVR